MVRLRSGGIEPGLLFQESAQRIDVAESEHLVLLR